MSDHGFDVSLRRQAPFKYLLSVGGGGNTSGRGKTGGGVASRPQTPQVVVLKAENHRLLVNKGPNSQTVDLVDVIAKLAASSVVTPRGAAASRAAGGAH